MSRVDGLFRLAALFPVCVFCAFALWQLKAHTATISATEVKERLPAANQNYDAGIQSDMPPLSLQVLIDRPLFSETRRPFVPEPEPEPEPEAVFAEPESYDEPESEPIAAEPSPVVPLPVYTLVGVVFRNAQAMAMLKNSETGETVTMQRGMSIGGWNLDDINARGVRMTAGLQSADIAVGTELPERF